MTTNDTAILDAARRLVNGFSMIPYEWARLVAQHIDEEDFIALPMWGTLFKVEDSCDKRSIGKLCRSLGVTEEDDITDIADFIDEKWMGDDIDLADYFHGEDGDDEGDADFYDVSRLVSDVMGLWQDSCDEDAMLACSGWQAVGDTGLLAREFDGHLLLGVNGAGYDFYQSHWVPLYRALGYKWHGRAN